ncbi:Mediator of RNA polymerase II transcription subunit 21 [Caenorhabditis elegans]|nr:Mediator of RNA polymerase II transcription subunit 21 [Caenorhabditis elegans]CUR29998.1 Mediator of RNA polymerase II transcription subunit 21 [Caenorhabditis elegans]|eukprot:NP_001303803.1 Uncharacterized protein CELE_W10D9.6 [Caenorhabditis elegans]
MPNASDLLIALRDINSQLRDVIVKQNSEFSTSTIPLPEYDTVDMQALLGTEEVAPQKSLLELVKEDQQRVQTNLDRILAEAEILLQEYDHMKNGLKI